jgi:hypothetical protein
VELKSSAALDALRKANLTGSLRDAVCLLLGTMLVAFSGTLPFLQEMTVFTIGTVLMITEAILLLMRSWRSFRSGREL